MSLTMTLSAAWVSSMTLAQAGNVQTYSNSIDPSRSEGMFSTRQFSPAAEPRDQLLNPAPYPDARTDGPDRVQNGRLWHSRFPVGNRTPIRELPRVANGGPADFGAPPDALDAVIFVQPDIIGMGVIAISPWDDLDSRTIENIRRTDPRLGRKSRPTDWRESGPLLAEGETLRRSRVLLRQLKAAQRQWLDEQGYILNVRTHVNPRRIYGPATRPASTIEPRGIIRVQPQPKDDSKLHVEAQPEANESQTARVSTPAHAKARTPIHVVEVSVPSSEASPAIESES